MCELCVFTHIHTLHIYDYISHIPPAASAREIFVADSQTKIHTFIQSAFSHRARECEYWNRLCAQFYFETETLRTWIFVESARKIYKAFALRRLYASCIFYISIHPFEYSIRYELFSACLRSCVCISVRASIFLDCLWLHKRKFSLLLSHYLNCAWKSLCT